MVWLQYLHVYIGCREEKVKFEPGVKRGKAFVPKYNEEQLAAMAKQAESEESVR